MRAGAPDPAESAIGRTAGVVYWFVVVDLLLVLACLPGAVMLMLLTQDASNIPLMALALLPVGPAVSAALFTWREFDRARDLSPASHFWRGYRLNAVDVLRLWVPAVVALAVLAINGANLGVTGLPSAVGGLLLVMGVGLVLWSGHALVITSLFSFRARDVARLAAFYLGTKPLVTLGLVSLLVLTSGLVVVVSDWVLGLVASLLTYLLLRNARPIVTDVARRFVQE